MFAKDFVVVLLTVEEDKDDDDDCEDDNLSPQAWQEEKENTPVPPPESENSSESYSSKAATAGKHAFSVGHCTQIDKDPTTASTITLITCYGVKIGPYPLVRTNQQLTLFLGP